MLCSSAPRGFYHGVGVGKPVGFEWKGLAFKNLGWKGDASQGNAEVE